MSHSKGQKENIKYYLVNTNKKSLKRNFDKIHSNKDKDQIAQTLTKFKVILDISSSIIVFAIKCATQWHYHWGMQSSLWVTGSSVMFFLWKWLVYLSQPCWFNSGLLGANWNGRECSGQWRSQAFAIFTSSVTWSVALWVTVLTLSVLSHSGSTVSQVVSPLLSVLTWLLRTRVSILKHYLTHLSLFICYLPACC